MRPDGGTESPRPHRSRYGTAGFPAAAAPATAQKSFVRPEIRPLVLSTPIRSDAQRFSGLLFCLFRYGTAQVGQKHKLRHVGRQHQGSGEVNYGPP